MGNLPAPIADELISFVRGLRHYRATLPGPAQLLLDALVNTGLGRHPAPEHSIPDKLHALWSAYAGTSPLRRNGLGAPDGVADWTTTPWGATHRRRAGLE